MFSITKNNLMQEMLRMEAESIEIQNIPSQLLLSGLKHVLHNCRGFPLRSSEHLQLEISGWYQLDANKFTTTSYNWTLYSPFI